jgi:hypothetical protein
MIDLVIVTSLSLDGIKTVCERCHVDPPTMVIRARAQLVTVCGGCYAKDRRERESDRPAHCQECGERVLCRDDLRSIHDVLRAKDGWYPIRQVCATCGERLWERIQDAMYGYWTRRFDRFLEQVCSFF